MGLEINMVTEQLMLVQLLVFIIKMSWFTISAT